MALIPTTQELAEQNLTGFEAQLGQTAPINDRAFLRVLAVVEAMVMTGLYKFAAERIRQTLAQTATGADLDLLGAEINVPRKLAEYTSLTAELTALDGIVIPLTTSFIATSNGIRYNPTAEGLSVGGIATLQLTAEIEGVVGNLSPGDILTIVSPVAGASATATVTEITNTGTEVESDEDYRERVLFAQYSTAGGSNTTSHKLWAESVAGVQRAFPYAGRPTGTSYPGDRTVYVESDTSINPDGVPTLGLITEVRGVINAEAALGLTDGTLWVEPITRLTVDITVTGLLVTIGSEAAVQTAIETAVDSYLREFHPYIEGVDLPQDRNDTITTLALSQMIQEVLATNNATASTVEFTVDGVAYDIYILTKGYLVKFGEAAYVAL